MQTINNPFDWYPRDTIKWPSEDTKLKLVNDWVVDVEKALEFCDRKGTAIQAGGACGIWPARLALDFTSVYTFEPCVTNYECLVENLEPFVNVGYTRAALGAEGAKGALKRDAFENGNAGAWYLVDGDQFQVITIDGLNLPECDLIMLDVEGFELEALQGAEETIKKYKPVVVVEAKQLPHMNKPATAAADYLKELGYTQVAKFHNDLVFKC